MDRLAKTGSIERDELAAALGRVAGGSRSALAEVYHKTSAKLFGICIRILGERAEAEDALQDIFISVWRKAGTFDAAKASPITWLAALARNRSIDRKRSQASRAPTSAMGDEAIEVADEAPDALAGLESAEEAGRIALCLGELEERQNRAIRAAFYEGLSYPEVARRLAVPLGTMKSWVRRGLLRLRECLER
ncbi:MAG TPA: sigma-70 family RNA polymerase sigma factor [Allosphingosinicella sp.]